MLKMVGNAVFFLLLTAGVLFVSVTPLFIGIPSKSMEPTLHVGDIVVTKKVQPEQLKRGDIVIVKVPESAQKKFGYPDRVVHRINRIEHNSESRLFYLKGDNNKDEDPFVLFPEHIEAGFRQSIPKLGYGILFLHSTYGRIFLLSAAGLYAMYLTAAFVEKRRSGWQRQISHMLVGDAVQEIRVLQEEIRSLRSSITKTPDEGLEEKKDDAT